jgi:hypothetical protein
MEAADPGRTGYSELRRAVWERFSLKTFCSLGARGIFITYVSLSKLMETGFICQDIFLRMV